MPIGILGMWLTQRFLPEFERNAPRRMDFVGFLLVGGFFAGLVFGISVISLPALPRPMASRRWCSAPPPASATSSTCGRRPIRCSI